MALFHAFVLLLWAFSGFAVFMVEAATNITSCHPSSNDTCIQGPCARSMPVCSLQCDQTSNYDKCSQYCDDRRCDTIACDAKVCLQNCSSFSCGNLYCSKNVINCEQESMSGNLVCKASTCNQSCDSLFCDAIQCRSSDVCNQFCNGNCESLLCDAKTCLQNCTNGRCDHLKCSENTTSCTQTAMGGEIKCQANSCQQVCDGRFCDSLECQAGEACTQHCAGTCPDIKCENSPICHQTCNGPHCSSVSCSKNVTRCEQYLSSLTLGKLICGANSCNQSCHGRLCNVNCASGVETCIQNATGTPEMTCDADVCTQVCTGARCKMTCLSNVRECVQVCGGKSCDYRCDAANCKLDCTADYCEKIEKIESPTASTVAITTGDSITGRVSCIVSLVVWSFIFM